jgi:hypothetical protein
MQSSSRTENEVIRNKDTDEDRQENNRGDISTHVEGDRFPEEFKVSGSFRRADYFRANIVHVRIAFHKCLQAREDGEGCE